MATFDPFNCLFEILDEQISAHNESDRFDNKNALIEGIHYCVNLADRLLNECLNTHYYPLMTTEQIDFIKYRNIAQCVLEIFRPYFIDASFITKTQHKLKKEIEQFEADEYLLYLRDQNSVYNEMLEYLHYVFINSI